MNNKLLLNGNSNLMEGGTLKGSGQVTVASNLTLKAGTITSLTLDVTQLLSIVGSMTITGATINVNGMSTINSTVTGSGSAKFKVNSASAKLELLSGAYLAGVNQWQLINSGTVVVSSLSPVNIEPQITNTGTINVNSNTLSLLGGGTTSSSIILSNSTLIINGGSLTFTCQPGGSIQGSSDVFFKGGVNTISCTYNIQGTTTVQGGTTTTKSAATLTSLGSTLVMDSGAGGTLIIDTSNAVLPSTQMKGGVLTLNWPIDFPYLLNVQGGAITFNNDATIRGELIVSGTVNVTTRMDLPSKLTILTGGNLLGNGIVSVSGLFNWYGGTVAVKTLNAYNTTSVANTVTLANTNGTFQNLGTILVNGTINGNSAAALTNNAGGTIQLQSAGNLTGGFVLTSYGLILKQSDGISFISVTLR